MDTDSMVNFGQLGHKVNKEIILPVSRNISPLFTGNEEWIQQRLKSHKPNRKPISEKTIANTKKEFLFLDRHLEYPLKGMATRAFSQTYNIWKKLVEDKNPVDNDGWWHGVAKTAACQ